MPTTLRHERDLELIATALQTGALAQDVVFALGKALHHEELAPEDHHALQQCAELLELLTAETPPPARTGGSSALFTGSSGMAALSAARATGHATDTLGYLRQLTTALKHYLAGSGGVGPEEGLRELRTLFLRIGEINLASVGRATVARDVDTPWISNQKSSPS